MRSVFALLLFTSAASAAPLAQLAQDVDGDGKPETIELDATGELRIGAAKIALGPQQTARLGVAQFRGAPYVVVDTGREAIILGKQGATWREILRTPVGGVGLDADYAIAIDATAQGIYRYQTRAGAQRCDGKPAYLFAEGFNGTKFQRLSKLPVGIPETAPVLTAKLDATPAPETLLYKARLASHQIGASDASALGIPAELDDGKPATLWREELAASAGEGQFFTFQPRVPGAAARQIRIVPGAPKGANRPQRLGLVSNSGAWHIDLPDAAKDPTNSAYTVDLPSPVSGCVTLVLESTYGPDKGATAIAELEVFADGERAGGGDAALAHVVATGSDGATSAAQALARRGAAAVAAIDTELAKTTDPNARVRLLRAATLLDDPSVGPLLTKALTSGWVPTNELVNVIKALGGRGAGTTLAELAQKSGTPLEARIAAVHSLHASDDAERPLLVTLAGRGPFLLRQAVIDALVDAGVDVLVPLAQAQPNARVAGDLWRAVTRRARGNMNERAKGLSAMTAALGAATEYDVRYRLVDGIAAIGDEAALRQLATTLASWPADESTAAYKQVAARAISIDPRPEATDLLVKLVSDADPGVRLAALSALGTATGTTAGPWHGDAGVDGIDRVIMTSLATDTWPEVRRSAAQLLATRCSRIGPARALADSVARDPELEVRGDALASLVECKAAGTAELLAKLWDDSKAPLPLRQRAVDLAANLGDRTLGAKLVARFTRWRGSAIESEEALALAQNAAFAIGRLGSPGAADALVAALDDEAFPEIVASAATGLGLLGPTCPASAKQRLAALAQSDEAQVVTAAKRAVAQCGK